MLVFTADEAWEFIPGKTADSVHKGEWKPTSFSTPVNSEVWSNLIALREHVLPYLEKARQEKQIGKALEARLVIKGKGENATFWKEEQESVQELLNISQFLPEAESTEPLAVPAEEVETRVNKPAKHYFKELVVNVTKADGQKCERCWHWETNVGSNTAHPTLCARCATAVLEFTAKA